MPEVQPQSLAMTTLEGPVSISLSPAGDFLNTAIETKAPQRPRHQHHSVILDHQLNELKHPDISTHSCHYCRLITVSTAPETEDKSQVIRWVNGGEEGPDSEQSLLISGWVREAAANGCALCELLVAPASYNPLGAQPDNVLHVRFHSHDNQSGLAILECEHDSNTSNISRVLGRFELYDIPQTGNQTYQPPNGPEPLLPPNLVPASNLSYARARSWLNDCQENHSECAKFNLVYMPTRVLEIIPSSSEPDSFTVRLLENPDPAPYATLSYCWGGEQPFKTTRDNLNRYKVKIHHADLSRTISDALTVVRAIGVRYLWVDALCIIQDDNKDMLTEITNMHRIYRGSFFTIAAAIAQSSQEGFLQPRVAYRGFKIKTTISVDGVPAKDVLAVPIRTPADLETYPLYKRAWTFQEDSLSTRILAYGNRGLVYKCLTASHCDGGHQECLIRSLGEENSPGTLLKQLHPGSQQLKNNSHPLAWGSMVQDYTNRLLSFPDDKLLAIAALAEEYSRTRPVTEYLAGMWKEDLPHQCLWQRTRSPPKGQPRFARPERYRAPSWSWASLDGSFRSFRPEHMHGWHDGARPSFSCRLVDAQTTLADETNPFGRVTGGVLRIYGRMKRLVWTRGTGDGYGWAYRGDDVEDDSLGCDESKADGRLDFIVDDLSEWPPNIRVSMWCMEFCTFTTADNFLLVARDQFSEERGSNMLLEGRGLLLLPVVGEEDEMNKTPTTFRRVGTVSFKGLPKGDPFFDRERYWFDDGEAEWREIEIV